MKILNIGGATAIVEHNGKRMLFDPWLDDGIFHGAWYHYPPSKIGIQDLGHLDYIYISHIHEDHCSAGTIKHLNRDAEIIVMDMPPHFVVKFLKAHGLEFKHIHTIKPFTPTEIAPGLIVDMVTADPAHRYNYQIDSGLVLKWDDHTIYNANDCPPYDEGLQYIRDHYGVIDLALLPYAGGSGYPVCYTNLSESEIRSESRRIATASMDHFIDSVRKLEPKHVMPFADQYVIAGSRSHLNNLMAHPPCPGAVIGPMEDAGLTDRLLLLMSGQAFDLESAAKYPDEPYRVHTVEDRSAYVDEHLKDKTYDFEHVDLNPAVSLDRLFHLARERALSAQKRTDYFPNLNLYFSISDRNQVFGVNLKHEGFTVRPKDAELSQPYVKMTCGSTLFALLLIGHVSWNIADAAMFFDYERVPNEYDTELYAFINHFKI